MREDKAKTLAMEIVENFEYMLREDEWRLAFEEVLRILRKSGEHQEIKPSRN